MNFTKDELPDETQKPDQVTSYKQALTSEEHMKSRMEKMIDMIRIQYEDMKQHFETQTKEIRKDIETLQRQQDETREIFANTNGTSKRCKT